MTDNVDPTGDVHAFQKAFDDAVEEYTKRTGVKIEHFKNETIESMRKEMARIDTGSTDRSIRQAARTGLDLLLKTGELVVGGVSSVSYAIVGCVAWRFVKLGLPSATGLATCCYLFQSYSDTRGSDTNIPTEFHADGYSKIFRRHFIRTERRSKIRGQHEERCPHG